MKESKIVIIAIILYVIMTIALLVSIPYIVMDMLNTKIESSREEKRSYKELQTERKIKELSERYGENFELSDTPCYTGDTFESARYNHFYIKTTDKNSPVYGKDIFVEIDGYKSSDKSIDSYIVLKFENETKNFINNIAKNYFDNFYLLYNAETRRTNSFDCFDKNTTFNEFISSGKVELSCTIQINENNVKSKTEFEKKLIEFAKFIDTKRVEGEKWFVDVPNVKEEYFGKGYKEIYPEEDWSYKKYEETLREDYSILINNSDILITNGMRAPNGEVFKLKK